MIRYVSTRGGTAPKAFDEVVVEGLASDGGLYVPSTWPSLPTVEPDASYADVAGSVVKGFASGSFVADAVPDLAARAYEKFRHPDVAPLRQVSDDVWLLELFWGPTLSFKDYALQLVGRLFEHLLASLDRRITILGATSGDTGSAAIEALRDRRGIEVMILFPAGKISEVQRRQMTTVPSANVHAVAVDGTFDDCQDLVKRALADVPVRRRFDLGAVNSINWARIAAQVSYYVWASRRFDGPVAFSVPTGNFGNIYAAHVARSMGGRVGRLVIANNENHGLVDLVAGGRLPISRVVASVAPAMDIQVPSNLERYLYELAGGDPVWTAAAMTSYREKGGVVIDEVRHARLAEDFSAGWMDDVAIERVISDVHRDHGLVLDPHSAVAWGVAAHHVRPGEPMVVVATAHPAKFPRVVERAVGIAPSLPDDLADLWEREERIGSLPASYDALIDLLAGVRN